MCEAIIFTLSSFIGEMQFISFSVADIRVEPKFRSERDSQLIYGEEVRVISEENDYCYIEGPDKLKGYVLKTLISQGSERKYKIRANTRTREMMFPFGSYVSDDDVSHYNIPKSVLLKIGDKLDPVDVSKEFLSVPYLWGGTSDLGYDCSGFTQRLFRFNNIEIPRNADWQRDNSDTVDGFGEAQEGDLVFFEGHVGLYLGENLMIHSNLHNGGVSYTNLKDGSDYSNFLMKIFEKIGRVVPSKIRLPF